MLIVGGRNMQTLRMSDYLLDIKLGILDYFNVLKTTEGSLNFFFSIAALSYTIELIKIII